MPSDNQSSEMNTRVFFILTILVLAAVGCGGAEPGAASQGEDAHLHDEDDLYTCGMHPQIVQKGPGQCPICGMDLTPKRTGEDGEGVVRIDPATIQNMGVRTAIVQRTELEKRVRTTGRFEANESGRSIVAPKVGGWVERLHVSYEGARVRRGQALMEIYSPELVSTQEEFLLAIRHAERVTGTSAQADARRLVEAARRRLSYWDLTEQQIETLVRNGTPTRTVTLFSPASGTVVNKMVTEGRQIMPGEAVFELADLSRIWLMADVFEQDLAWVQVGTSARIELPYEPGRTYDGRVEYVYDTLDPQTRSARARISLANPGLTLKPGMYATITLVGSKAAESAVVPSEALVRSGERNLVLLAMGDGRFRPQEVRIGLETTEGIVQVLEGLQGGEEIVTSAQFLIDSEARLQSAVAAMGGGHIHGQTTSAGDRGREIDVSGVDGDGDGHVYQCDSDPAVLHDVPSPTGCEGAVKRVTIGAAHTALHKAGHRNVPVRLNGVDENGDGTVYQCPMDWAVLHDTPGRCEVCGMFLEGYSIGEAEANLKAASYQVHAH